MRYFTTFVLPPTVCHFRFSSDRVRLNRSIQTAEKENTCARFGTQASFDLKLVGRQSDDGSSSVARSPVTVYFFVRNQRPSLFGWPPTRPNTPNKSYRQILSCFCIIKTFGRSSKAPRSFDRSAAIRLKAAALFEIERVRGSPTWKGKFITRAKLEIAALWTCVVVV